MSVDSEHRPSRQMLEKACVQPCPITKADDYIASIVSKYKEYERFIKFNYVGNSNSTIPKIIALYKENYYTIRINILNLT